MNAGQMIVQMPLGAMLGSAMTANSPAASSPAGEQQAGIFSGIMGELSAQAAAPAGLVADTAKQVAKEVPVAKDQDTAKDNAGTGAVTMPDLLVSLLAAMGTAEQAVPAVIGNAAEVQGQQKEQPEVEVKMPQNVALFDGRTPVSEQKPVESGRDNGNAVADFASLQGQQHHQTVNREVFPQQQPVVSVNVSMPESREAQIPQEVVQGMARTAAVLESHLDGRTPVLEQKPVENGRDNGNAVAELASLQGQQHHQAVNREVLPLQQPVVFVNVSTPEPAEVQMPQEGVQGMARAAAVPESHLDGRMPEPEQKTVVTGRSQEQTAPVIAHQQRIDVIPQAAGEVAATAVRTAAVEPRQAVADVVTQTPATPVQPAEQVVMATIDRAGQETAVQPQAITGPATKPEPENALLEGKALEAPIVLPAMATRRMPANLAGFRFARPADVDVQLGNDQQVDDRIPQKTANGLPADLKVAVARQAEPAEASSNTADSSVTGKGFVFTQQPAETARPVPQHFAAVQQSTVSETASTTPLQATRAETPLSEMHESIAGQVRERLAGHEVKAGNDQIVFRLSPENLGDIKVHLRMDDQRLKVEIVAENRLAREGLLQHVDSLKESLSRQNISMEKFTVTSGNSQTNSQWNGNAHGEWRELAKNRQAQQWLASGGYRVSTEAAEVQAPPLYLARSEHSMLDLHF